MLTLLILLWSLIRGFRPSPQIHATHNHDSSTSTRYNNHLDTPKITPELTPTPTPEPTSQEISDKPTPSPEPEYPSEPEEVEVDDLASEESSITRISSASRPSFGGSSRYSDFATSRTSSVEVGNDSRASITSLSSSSLSWRRYEMTGQRSIDSRASLTSIFSTDVSRRDSEVIFEQEDESTDSRASFASAGSMVSSDGTTRRYSETMSKRRRSSARGVQLRRNTRRFPLTYDRRRTTGR